LIRSALLIIPHGGCERMERTQWETERSTRTITDHNGRVVRNFHSDFWSYKFSCISKRKLLSWWNIPFNNTIHYNSLQM